jgi:hypothetical protein
VAARGLGVFEREGDWPKGEADRSGIVRRANEEVNRNEQEDRGRAGLKQNTNPHLFYANMAPSEAIGITDGLAEAPKGGRPALSPCVVVLIAYNRHVKHAGLAVVAAALLLAGCSRNVQTAEAVREGVISHLAGRAGLDIGSMDVEVASVTFRDNEADATVSFRPKGSTDPASGMQMRYTLERQGGRWVVKSKGEAGETPHGAGAEMGSDPHGGMAPGGNLPPGHPPLGEATPPAAKP